MKLKETSTPLFLLFQIFLGTAELMMLAALRTSTLVVGLWKAFKLLPKKKTTLGLSGENALHFFPFCHDSVVCWF